MYEDYTQERIAQLRTQKNVSARDMSLSLGLNESYITHIENKQSLPSMQVFFYICEYFGITPNEFFDEENKSPEQLSELINNIKKLDLETLSSLNVLVKKLAQGK